MANRSDFFKTSRKNPRVPRFYKKLVALASTGDKGYDRAMRRQWMEAHLAEVEFRQRRAGADSVDTTEN